MDIDSVHCTKMIPSDPDLDYCRPSPSLIRNVNESSCTYKESTFLLLANEKEDGSYH